MSFELEDLVAWSKAFAFTQVVEMPIYRFALPTRWAIAFLASAITHPFVWFAFPLLGERMAWSWELTSFVSEVFAVVVEAAFFRRVVALPWRRALGVSLLANFASVALGLLVRHLTGLI